MAAVPLDSRRRAALQAMGITPWVMRERAQAQTQPVAIEQAATLVRGAQPSGRCVVLLPAGADARALDLLGRALTACGAEIARAGRIRVADGQLSDAVPHAPVYLVFGQAQAHALGRELPAAVMSDAHIALVDEPGPLLFGAEGKRRLWAALRQARRALGRAGG
ncbi:hypothetical protein ISP17_08610 [Dyella ginsengisoli]|jgi:hypothetical protein|uniref:DNA polymerase III subunit delta n=1 Tax=Dyella ginsengisoli TaxID=363848 RepID=A0ABW8JWG9_9GAMM